MRALILAAGAALTLSACGGGGDAAENNTLAVDTLDAGNLIVNDPAAMNGTATMDANATGAAGATANNAVMQDQTTNSPDTNLANGL